MKKVFALLLAITLIGSMTLPAFAVDSPTATEEDLTPTTTTTTTETDTTPTVTTGSLVITDTESVENLPEAAQEVFAESKEVLNEVAVEKDTVVQSTFYATLEGDIEETDAGFEVNNYQEPVVMQYVDGEWVELEVVVNPDQTVTVKGLVEGPVAFLIPAPPVVVSSSNDKIIVLSEQKVSELPREARQVYSQAKRVLSDAVPEGMLVRNMFNIDNVDAGETASAVFEIGSFREVDVKQFENNSWNSRNFTRNNDNSITVHGLTNGPMAFFVN